MKLAVIFNGQGAHYQNMGLDFYEQYSQAQETLSIAEEVTEYPIVSWLSQENTLNKTKYAQPAITATSLAIYNSIAPKLPVIDYMAGLSLGEYSALIASGMLSMEDGFRLNKERGLIMGNVCQDISENNPKYMAAVLKTPVAVIETIADDVLDLYIANYNSENQTIIAGSRESIQLFNQLSKERGYKKTMPLKLEGPFHTPFMNDAVSPYRDVLSEFTFNESNMPVISNTTLEPHTPETVKETLISHLTCSVRWAETITLLKDKGVTHILQIGPGDTLVKMLKRDKVPVHSLVIDSVDDVNQLEEFFNKGDIND